MTSLAARVRSVIRRRRLVTGDGRVAAAVSGGADSVALAYLLAELSAAGVLELVGLVHLDHGLRGDESSRDADFCRLLAARLGIPIDLERADVGADALARRVSREQAARDARYAFFDRARARLGADLVAVAHTRDDQAETVLLRLLRGAGTRGIAGIPPSRGAIVRPLLETRRVELVTYLRTHRREWVEDSTNADLAIPRNWIRHRLLPAVAERFGPGAAEAIARAGDLARADEAYLAGMSSELAARLSTPSPGGLAIDPAGLLGAPLALSRRVVLAALGQEGGRPATSAEVDAVLDLLARSRPVTAQVGACELELSRPPGVLLIRAAVGVPRQSAAMRSWSRDLAVPGVVDVPEAGGRISAETARLEDLGGFDAAIRGGPDRVVTSGTGSELVVRSWLPGDTLEVLGLSGRKKVQDLFVDRKVPRPRRHRVPLVVARDGRIVWVAGHALGEAFRVTPATKSVVVLKFEPLGGPD